MFDHWTDYVVEDWAMWDAEHTYDESYDVPPEDDLYLVDVPRTEEDNSDVPF